MKTIHNQSKKRILLVSLPFFTPITPPVGISVLKSYLESYHNDVFCMDFNVNDKLWGIHHNYFNLIKSANRLTDNIGYSTLWWILNAHLMAYTNTRDHDVCFKIVNEVLPKFYLSLDATTIYKLVELIERFFKILTDDINKEDYTNFGVVGVSTYSTSLASSLFFLQEVKKEYPNIKTIMGGGAFSDDLAIGSFNLNVLENEYSSVDHVVVGEGELLLLGNLEDKLPKKFILSKKDILDRQVDLNTIPLPDYTDFDLSYYSNLGIEGSRSCPYQCEFCSETIQWGKFRKKKQQSPLSAN